MLMNRLLERQAIYCTDQTLNIRQAERSFRCRGRPGRRLREASATSYAPDWWVNRRDGVPADGYHPL